jgi:type IV secretory pathway VirB10-like protein
MMKNLVVAVALLTGFATFSLNLNGQTAQKPSSYSGVSQPPPDATITSDTASPATPSATLVTRPTAPEAAPAPVVALAATTTPAASVPAVAKAPCNSEDRMIGDPDPCLSAPVVEVETAQQKPSPDADADIVISVPTRPGELPEGTVIKIALDHEIATGQSTVGADFSGRVSGDVVSLGKVVIPQGAQVVGKIVQVTEGHRFGSPATIRLRPDVVVLPDGSRYVLRAQVIDTSTKSRIDDEGTLKPASRLKTNVIKEAAGIGTGAVVGAVVGGGPGALVGSLIGAGIMTTNILVQHPADVKIPKDSTLVLSLTQPMSISPEVASVAPGGSN